MSEEFTVERDNLGPLVFDGIQLAHVSTDRPHKDRWVEFTIYRTNGGSYISSIVGCSRIEGEVQRHSAWVHDTPTQLVRSFTNRGNVSFSAPAVELLDLAADQDEAVADVLDVIIDQPQRID